MEHSGPAFLVFLQRQRISSARGTRRVSAAPRYHPLCPPGEPFLPASAPSLGLPGKSRKKTVRSKPRAFGPLVFELAGSTWPPPCRNPGANPGRRRPFFRPPRGDLVHG